MEPVGRKARPPSDQLALCWGWTAPTSRWEPEKGGQSN